VGIQLTGIESSRLHYSSGSSERDVATIGKQVERREQRW
jgi:hypothetical protein